MEKRDKMLEKKAWIAKFGIKKGPVRFPGSTPIIYFGLIRIMFASVILTFVIQIHKFLNLFSSLQFLADEEAIIRNMLALEEARIDYINGEMKKYVHEESPDENKTSTNSIKEKVVAINPVVNDINHQLQKSKYEDQIRLNSTPKHTYDESYKSFHFPAKSEVFTNAGAAAYAIANRDNCKIPNSCTQPKKEEKAQKPNKPNKPTPTHILKVATYYNDSNEVKTSKPAFTTHDFPISKNGVCPYCHSSDVVYIILQEDGDVDELPPLLERLHKEGKAVKRKKGFIFVYVCCILLWGYKITNTVMVGSCVHNFYEQLLFMQQYAHR